MHETTLMVKLHTILQIPANAYISGHLTKMAVISRHSMHRRRNPYAARKLHGSDFYQIIAEWSFTTAGIRNLVLQIFVNKWTWFIEFLWCCTMCFMSVFCFFPSVSLYVFFFSVYVVCFMCIYGPQLSEINEWMNEWMLPRFWRQSFGFLLYANACIVRLCLTAPLMALWQYWQETYRRFHYAFTHTHGTITLPWRASIYTLCWRHLA